MEDIKQFLLSVCGATAISGIFQIFLSNSNLKKSINVFLSIFVLFYTLMPLSNLNFEEFKFEFDRYSTNALNQEAYEEIISTSINNVCVKNSVEVITIDIDSYINDDYLQIDKIIVKISNPEKAQLIENEIKKQLGYEVIVNWKI